MKTLIIIPIKNRETELLATVEEVQKNSNGMDFLFIDYGSTDRTKYILENNEINRIQLPLKGTYEDAVGVGIKFAHDNGYDNVIQFDVFKGLSSNDLVYFERSMLNNKVDLILGSRYLEKTNNKIRKRFYIRVLKVAIKIVSKKRVTDPAINLRMMNRKVMKVIIENEEWSLTPASISHLLRAGFNFMELQITEPNKELRKKSINKFKLLKYVWFQLLTILFVQPFRKKVK